MMFSDPLHIHRRTNTTYLAYQPIQSADLLSKAQTTHPFKFCCANRIVKKEGFHMRLKNHGS